MTMPEVFSTPGPDISRLGGGVAQCAMNFGHGGRCRTRQQVVTMVFRIVDDVTDGRFQLSHVFLKLREYMQTVRRCEKETGRDSL